ncbi:unnamed protein product [Oikopleura dioica]|uniref:Uncharacterized protein n=1 Tax=Oikopleura dioica TaxID=34765 RepID=E4X1D7_OIKDI|nr:unnamed protein product [Oikopleura dioica]CBY30649.1 unnamed protein product [Oikopleura dioica]
MFVDPIYAELVASEGEKESVIQLFLDIIDRIVENGYTMPDYDGIPTKWGHWDPYSVNQDMDRYSERGLNSLQILTYLSAAEVLVKKYGMTAKNDYMAHFDYLYNGENYKRNLGNVKLQATSEDNYSDDEQQFLAYYLFYFTVLRDSHLSSLDDETIAVFKDSLYKTWKHVSYSENSVMAGVALAMLGDELSEADKDFTKKILVKDLVRMPISQVTWDFDATPGTTRKDMYLDPNIDRWGDVGSHVTLPIPKDEQAYLQWNADPFMFTGSGGNREYPGTLYLLPYWLARYQNILST